MARHMKQKPKAYSYVRISSKGQIEGRGIARQFAAAQEYADKHGLELDEQLKDVGKSGFHGDHVKFGALGGFLRLVKDRQIPVGSYLLVESLDRLSREDVLIAQAQFIEILSAGINIVTLIDGMHYHKDKDFTQLIISLTYMSRANNESAEKSKRIKDVIRKRKLDMLEGKPRYNHHIPGWIDQERVPGTQHDYHFSLNEKAKSILRIFELYDSGMGAWSIAKTLNTEGHPVLRPKTNVDGKWKDAQIQLLLRNEMVIGTYQVSETIDGKEVPMGPPLKNYYPKAVPDELFWRVQRNRIKPKPVGRLGRRYSNLFARITSCSGCGRILRLSKGGGPNRRISYFSCMQNALIDGHQCSDKFFPYDALEEGVLTYATDFYEAAAAEMNVPQKNKVKLAKQHEEATEYLNGLEARRANLMELAEEGLYAEDKAGFAKRIRELREKIEQQKAYIGEIETDLRHAEGKRDELKTVIDRIEEERKKWKTGTDEEVMQSRSLVSQMLREFITTVEVDFEAQEAIVWVGGFTSAYRFDRKGNLTGHVNILPMLYPGGGVRTIIDRTPSGRVRSVRQFNDESTQPAMTETMMVEFMQNMGWSEDRIALALKASKRIYDALA